MGTHEIGHYAYRGAAWVTGEGAPCVLLGPVDFLGVDGLRQLFGEKRPAVHVRSEILGLLAVGVADRKLFWPIPAEAGWFAAVERHRWKATLLVGSVPVPPEVGPELYVDEFVGRLIRRTVPVWAVATGRAAAAGGGMGGYREGGER